MSLARFPQLALPRSLRSACGNHVLHSLTARTRANAQDLLAPKPFGVNQIWGFPQIHSTFQQLNRGLSSEE
jgi:hypothetical protein